MNVSFPFKTTALLQRVFLTSGFVLLCGASQQATAQCMQSGQLKGINLAGAEFNSSRLPGVLNKDYLYPAKKEIDHAKGIGSNVIRLPFRWERIQPALQGELDSAELKSLQTTVQRANEAGMCVILDVHNYATYRGQPIGSDAVPTEAFIDLWKRLAAAFPQQDQTIFGLMNEPAKINIAAWAAIAQQTVNELRAAGIQNIILAAGGRWSGAHEWTKDQGGTSNGKAFANFQDPLDRTWLEVHQYADEGFAGTKTDCVDADRLQRIFANVTNWARENRKKLYLGEFGTPSDEKCLAALDAMLSGTNDTSVWRGWTYWAGGAWWGSYPMSIHPRNGVDAPQTDVLKKYF
ncbi:MAG: glycoside hydrolase family 5 protein [Oxalicibacterium faecigallinarum]|uniref:glycoside hydrolase family 5 protein n=1 Tax=Oxalicibacterium faecigallinarum TaxID=573741 RepID=UPI002808E270|nr:glycoside hydrolase family 5 protein [Oxalicibacterium faecigallinarum]MDQ7969247.1 glycoside hydrolase family 5 protein [Oxalicibacterium faecigallinarum]